ncbi:MAG: 5-formyltetrahydrofolate cyclo-ligase [Treponema sp.]|nr:5-formyltetrahydrofolate cyclo-ligase [Treponema sp.]
MSRKDELRIRISSLVKGMSAAEKDAESVSCVGKIISMREFQEADCVLCYMALENEVNVRAVVDEALRLNKTVALPKVVADMECMVFYRVSPARPLESQLEAGAWGIREPVSSEDSMMGLESFAGLRVFAVVPGVAFSAAGERLGHGKGFYDKFFNSLLSEENKKCPAGVFCAGACFKCQKVDSVPVSPTDVPVDVVVCAD